MSSSGDLMMNKRPGGFCLFVCLCFCLSTVNSCRVHGSSSALRLENHTEGLRVPLCNWGGLLNSMGQECHLLLLKTAELE